MIKREENGKFERLPSIQDTVIHGSLLLTLHDQNDRKRDVKIGYEQGKESKIYKRTRLNIVSPRVMHKWPTSLLLSGKKFFDPTAGSITTTSDVEDIKTVDSEYDQLPPIVDDKLVLLEPSKSFYTDFGLRTHNTDTFSGYGNMKKKKRHKTTSYVEKEIEKKALKHIHAIQVLSNSKRGSYAIRSVNALKETLGPVRLSTEVMLPTSYVRSEATASPDNKHPYFVDVAKKAPHVIVRTRECNAKDVTNRRGNPLPQISGRTMLGFETKSNTGESTIKENT
jgi:hypothetical protein